MQGLGLFKLCGRRPRLQRKGLGSVPHPAKGESGGALQCGK